MPGVRPQSLYNPTSPRGPSSGKMGALRKSLTLSSHCSWKCTAILLMLTSCILAAAVAYLIGNPPTNYEGSRFPPLFASRGCNPVLPVVELTFGIGLMTGANH